MKFNFLPLCSPIKNDDVIKYKQRYIVSAKNNDTILVVIIFALTSPVFVIILLAFKIIYLAAISWLLLVAATYGFILGKNKKFQANIDYSKNIHLMNFAEANGMSYTPEIDKPNTDGAVFGYGMSLVSRDVFKSESKEFSEIGNYEYIVGNNTIKRGYIVVELNRKLPHMVLDSKKNNGNIFGLLVNNLPVSFDKEQKQSLEGDFDSYFTLYTPKGYERDALYVFTPDLMMLFIDKINNYDAEVIDDKLYIYSDVSFDFFDRGLFEQLFHIIDTVAQKAIHQTKNYSEIQVGDNSNKDTIRGRLRLKIKSPLKTVLTIYALMGCAMLLVLLLWLVIFYIF